MSNKNFSTTFKKNYNKQLNYIDTHRKDFVVNPEKQIRSGGKIKPSEIIRIMTTMTSGTLDDALYNADADYSVPALIKQRDRLDASVFKTLIDWSYRNGTQNKQWKGYHLFACDGTDVATSATGMPKEYIFTSKENRLYTLMHVNALYDVCNNLYFSTSVVSRRKEGEINQLRKMLTETNFPKSSILICDRGYSSIGLIYDCVVKGVDICLRMRNRWIQCFNNLPDEDMDFIKEYSFTTSQDLKSKKAQKAGQVSIVHKRNVSFDGTITLKLRVVKFQLPSGEWETLITTVTNRLTTNNIKELYHLRWGIETSFRTLKYRISMRALHAKKLNAITLELYAKVLSYNLCMAILTRIDVSSHKSKYNLKVNKSKGIIRVLRFLRAKVWLKSPIEYDIAKYVIPDVPKNNQTRSKRPSIYIPDMCYRAA